MGEGSVDGVQYFPSRNRSGVIFMFSSSIHPTYVALADRMGAKHKSWVARHESRQVRMSPTERGVAHW